MPSLTVETFLLAGFFIKNIDFNSSEIRRSHVKVTFRISVSGTYLFVILSVPTP